MIGWMTASAVPTASDFPVPPAPRDDSGDVRNWSGSVAFRPRVDAEAHTEQHVVDAVRWAARAGATIRPCGSLHSSTPLFETGDVLLTVDEVSGLKEYREDAGYAVLGAGTNLAVAGDELQAAGAAMENLGDVSYQTLAGAIGTATHGTGRELGNLSSTLVGGRLVTADGTVHAFGSESDEDDDDLLRAVRVSLGTLGVLTSVTVRVLPFYELHRRNWITHIDWVIDNFDQLVAEHRHFDFYWYPRSDQAQVRILDRPEDDGGLVPGPDARLKTDQRGPSHLLLTNERELRFDEMEYMLPLEAGMAAFRDVRERVKHKHRQYVGWRVLVRTVAPDDAMLSNCRDRPTLTIALLQNNTLDYQSYFDDMEPLLRDFGGRPHWGKKHSLTADELAPLYPEWDAFRRLRRSLDPEGIFLNPYLRALLGEEES